MRARQRPFSGRRPASPYDAFVAHIIQAQGQPAEHRLRVAEVPAFLQALWGSLAARGLKEYQILTVLHGRLVGICPSCRMRLSLEYLQWLWTAPAQASGQRARELDRFARGQCVNVECAGTEMIMYWMP